MMIRFGSTIEGVICESWTPRILCLGGTTRSGSTSERALRAAFELARAAGADTYLLLASDLELPAYAPHRGPHGLKARRMIELARQADGIILSTPGFHGGPSGLIKNALDHLEELRVDDRPYLDGRAVGCLVCAAGSQATITTLSSIRSTVHALRGWPTPLGVTINTGPTPDGTDPVAGASAQLSLLVGQVVDFARWRRMAKATTAVVAA